MICNNCDRLPSRALASRGRLWTTFLRLRICETFADATFELLTSRTSEDASYIRHQGLVQCYPESGEHEETHRRDELVKIKLVKGFESVLHVRKTILSLYEL